MVEGDWSDIPSEKGGNAVPIVGGGNQGRVVWTLGGGFRVTATTYGPDR